MKPKIFCIQNKHITLGDTGLQLGHNKENKTTVI